MKDQVDALVEQGVDATFVNSSLQREQRMERYYAGIANGQVDLLSVRCERMPEDMVATHVLPVASANRASNLISGLVRSQVKKGRSKTRGRVHIHRSKLI